MNQIDYIVMFIYIIGVFMVGSLFGTRIKDAKDMFSAGGQSPWWVSGLSGFMTMFSAGTFVVWGGIAFKHGLVAVSINMAYGIAALLVGYFVAGHWRKLGVNTPAEYLELRFGKAAIKFYTFAMMVYRLVGVGVALYSLAVILTALMPLPMNSFFRDITTGNLAIHWAILFFGSIVVLYTMIGGLWAVLMTDVLQFIVLNLAVLFVVPLAFMEAGGISEFIRTAPEGFFWPTTGEYTWLFLAGWVAIHFFMLGAEWAFVQRYLCVPNARDARKSSYLFGILYLISPLFWLLPPLLYRAIDPSANPEEAYILACQRVLPVGMLGLMVAAMFSATASMVSSQLNVFAGVLTYDFYHKIFKLDASEKHLVSVGRIITIFIGVILIIIAVLVPYMGGAESVIVSVTSLLVGPMLLPSLWGLFSKRIKQSSIWFTAFISFGVGAIIKFGLTKNGWFDGFAVLSDTIIWVTSNLRSLEIVAGVILPFIILVVIEYRSKGISEGWNVINKKTAEESEHLELKASPLPAKIVAWAIGICALLMFSLWMLNGDQVLLLFSLVLTLIAAILAWLAYKIQKSE